MNTRSNGLVTVGREPLKSLVRAAYREGMSEGRRDRARYFEYTNAYRDMKTIIGETEYTK